MTPNAGENEETGILLIAGGNIKWYSHFENSLQFLTKLNIFLPHHPAVTLLGTDPKQKSLKLNHTNLNTGVYSTFIHNHRM